MAKGYKVSGSDLVSSEITDFLKMKGAEIIITNIKNQKLKIKNKIKKFIEQSDLVIYSPATSKDHPELEMSRKFGIRYQSYPEALGELSKKYFTVAVCGTHGKSTVTAMTGLILVKAGFEPTVLVGTRLKEFGNSNFRAGKSSYLVIEADE